MKWIYDLIPNYGWAIIIFTIVVRLASFPLQLYQQKTTARMSVYQPMMMEIQKKYANNRIKQNEEMMKLQEEYGFSPTAGCMPMFLNFFVIFGVIEVVYRPVQHVLMIGADAIEKALSVIGLVGTNYTAQSTLMQTIQGMSHADALAQFGGAFSAEQIELIQNFHMDFFGIDLCAMPTLSLSHLELLVFPILSVLSMCLVNVITMKMSGQQMTPSMKMMPWLMSIFFVYFCFKVPVAFSLYYTISNLLMIVTSWMLRKMYDPEKYKAELAAEIEAKKQAKKAKKKIKVVDADGKETIKNLNEAEMNRYRIELARKLDAEKYKDERTVPLSELGKEE